MTTERPKQETEDFGYGVVEALRKKGWALYKRYEGEDKFFIVSHGPVDRFDLPERGPASYCIAPKVVRGTDYLSVDTVLTALNRGRVCSNVGYPGANRLFVIGIEYNPELDDHGEKKSVGFVPLDIDDPFQRKFASKLRVDLKDLEGFIRDNFQPDLTSEPVKDILRRSGADVFV